MVLLVEPARMLTQVYIHLGVALAGLVSFLSPCVLPLVPPYLGYISGTTSEQMTDKTEAGAHPSSRSPTRRGSAATCGGASSWPRSVSYWASPPCSSPWEPARPCSASG